MMKHKLYLAMILAMILGLSVYGGAQNTAHARPLSYPGGVMVMIENDGSENGFEIDYTLTPKWAIGIGSQLNRETDVQTHRFHLNHLAWRGNFPASQANLYVLTGLGYTKENGSNKDNPSAHIGLSADWEDRRFYTLYETHYDYAGHLDRTFSQKIRFGVAPYIGEAGDLHSWAILQIQHTPNSEHHFTVTPVLRLFKDTNLFEIGYDNHDRLLLNFTKQF